MKIKVFQVCLYHRWKPYPKEEEKKKRSESSITGNKITQDLDNMSKEAKMGRSIDGKNFINIESTFDYLLMLSGS